MGRARAGAMLVLALFLALLGGGGAHAVVSPDYEWRSTQAEVVVDGRIGRATKWRPHRVLGTGNPVRVHVGLEPHVLGPSDVRLSWARPDDFDLRSMPSGPAWSVGIFSRAICRSSTGTVTEGALRRIGGPSTVWPGSLSKGDPTVRQTTLTADNCGTGYYFVGMRIFLAFGPQADLDADTAESYRDGPVLVWHIDNANVGPEPWNQWSKDRCVEVFGELPWAPGDWGVDQGNPVQIDTTPCLELQDDWATDFDRVCSGAPEFEFYTVLGISVFPTMGSLGRWIGHYARCLFYPQRGFNTEPIAQAAQEGWMGASRSIFESVAADFGAGGGSGAGVAAKGGAGIYAVDTSVRFGDEDLARAWLGDSVVDELASPPVAGGSAKQIAGGAGAEFGVASSYGGCGALVETLPVIGEGVDSCQVGQIWPDSFRTAAGALLMITACFTALFAVLRFMGIRYGWYTG